MAITGQTGGRYVRLGAKLDGNSTGCRWRWGIVSRTGLGNSGAVQTVIWCCSHFLVTRRAVRRKELPTSLAVSASESYSVPLTLFSADPGVAGTG
jgi:hypothetical protein